MTGDLGRDGRDLRVSDADRERVAERLRVAAGEGRLTLEELEQRLEAAYRTRTYGELEPLVADLPEEGSTGAAGPVARRGTVEIRQTGSSIKRGGRWVVPRRLIVRGKHGSARLDFSAAVIEHREVEVVLDRKHGSTRIIVPPGAAVDTDDLEMAWGSLKNKADGVSAPGAPRFRVTGVQRHGSVTIGYPRKRWAGRLVIRFLRLVARRRG